MSIVPGRIPCADASRRGALTASRDYVNDGIHMDAVDTGWVTNEDPAIHADRKKLELDFAPPLDIVDGAARVCDPFFSGLITARSSNRGSCHTRR